jgi:multiple antibiotic resistance protein
MLMIASAVAFLVLLNPFALFIYLQPVMRELSRKDFMKVLFNASVVSLLIFEFFAVGGEFFFDRILQIRFEAFRIFGGVIIFSFAFMYIIHGRRSLIDMKEDLDDLASEIALPFMIGAGTISLSILMGHHFRPVKSFVLLTAILSLNYLIILGLMYARQQFSTQLKVAFDKLMETSLRLNGFFVGAIGLNMIITGVNNLYF